AHTAWQHVPGVRTLSLPLPYAEARSIGAADLKQLRLGWIVARTGIECRAHHFGERCDLVRLAQNRQSVRLCESLGIPARQQHRNLGVFLADLFRERHAVEVAREHHVGKYEVDRRAVRKEIERGPGIVDCNRAIVELLQERDGNGLYVRIVLDNQNGLTAARRLTPGFVGNNRGDLVMAAPQIERDLGSLANLGTNGTCTARLLCETVGL